MWIFNGGEGGEQHTAWGTAARKCAFAALLGFSLNTPSIAAPLVKKAFGPWTLACAQSIQSASDCALVQAAKDDALQMSTTLAFSYSSDGDLILAITTNPIRYGKSVLSFVIDAHQIGLIGAKSCDASRCTFETKMKWKNVAQFSSGRRLEVQQRIAADSESSLIFTLDKLREGLASLHTDVQSTVSAPLLSQGEGAGTGTPVFKVTSYSFSGDMTATSVGAAQDAVRSASHLECQVSSTQLDIEAWNPEKPELDTADIKKLRELSNGIKKCASYKVYIDALAENQNNVAVGIQAARIVAALHDSGVAAAHIQFADAHGLHFDKPPTSAN